MVPCSSIGIVAVAGSCRIDLFNYSAWNGSASRRGWAFKIYLTCPLAQAALGNNFHLVWDGVSLPLIVGRCAGNLSMSRLVIDSFDPSLGNG